MQSPTIQTGPATDPLTKLPADQWVTLAKHLVNGNSVIGKSWVFMVNATGEELIAVNCEGEVAVL